MAGGGTSTAIKAKRLILLWVKASFIHTFCRVKQINCKYLNNRPFHPINSAGAPTQPPAPPSFYKRDFHTWAQSRTGFYVRRWSHLPLHHCVWESRSHLLANYYRGPRLFTNGSSATVREKLNETVFIGFNKSPPLALLFGVLEKGERHIHYVVF